jgi:hypothetical protein
MVIWRKEPSASLGRSRANAADFVPGVLPTSVIAKTLASGVGPAPFDAKLFSGLRAALSEADLDPDRFAISRHTRKLR